MAAQKWRQAPSASTPNNRREAAMTVALASTREACMPQRRTRTTTWMNNSYSKSMIAVYRTPYIYRYIDVRLYMNLISNIYLLITVRLKSQSFYLLNHGVIMGVEFIPVLVSHFAATLS